MPPQDIEAAYRDIAADQACEQEASEWSEAVIADSSLPSSVTFPKNHQKH
jgi:hypothetical protein